MLVGPPHGGKSEKCKKPEENHVLEASCRKYPRARGGPGPHRRLFSSSGQTCMYACMGVFLVFFCGCFGHLGYLGPHLGYLGPHLGHLGLILAILSLIFAILSLSLAILGLILAILGLILAIFGPHPCCRDRLNRLRPKTNSPEVPWKKMRAGGGVPPWGRQSGASPFVGLCKRRARQYHASVPL